MTTEPVELGIRAELLPHNKIPGFYSECGEAELGKETVRFSMALAGPPCIYVFTDRPHPEDTSRKQIWVIPIRPAIEAFCQHLVETQ